MATGWPWRAPTLPSRRRRSCATGRRSSGTLTCCASTRRAFRSLTRRTPPTAASPSARLERAPPCGGVLRSTPAAWRGYLPRPIPTLELLCAWREMGGRITLTSDCHDRRYLAHAFLQAAALARQAGFQTALRLGTGEALWRRRSCKQKRPGALPRGRFRLLTNTFLRFGGPAGLQSVVSPGARVGGSCALGATFLKHLEKKPPWADFSIKAARAFAPGPLFHCFQFMWSL